MSNIDFDTTVDTRYYADIVGHFYNEDKLNREIFSDYYQKDETLICNKCVNNLSDADCEHDYTQITLEE